MQRSFPLLFFGLLFLCIPSYSMKLTLDENIGPETNFTSRYWERVSVVINDTKASLKIGITLHSVLNGSTPITGYIVIYNATGMREDLHTDGSFTCCTSWLAATKSCVVGTLIREQSSAKLYAKNFTLDAKTPDGLNHTEILDWTGTYVMLISVCENASVHLEGQYAWESSHGFIFPEEYPLITISQVLAGFYFIVLLVFSGLCVVYRANLLYIHYGILCTLLLSVSNQCLWYYYYHLMNKTGEWTLAFLGFAVLIQIVTQIARLVLLLLLSLGLGTNVALLKTARVVDYDVINLDGFGDEEEDKDGVEPYTSSSVNSTSATTSSSFLCWKSQPSPPSCDRPLAIRLVIFCILTFIFQYVDSMQSTAQVYSPSYLLGKTTAVFVTGMTILLTLIFYVWVVINIINTFRFLKGHPMQLRDYKLLLAALVVAFVLGLGTMGYKVYSKIVEGNLSIDVAAWNSFWENRLLWSLVTAFLLFSIAAIWNPHRNSSFNRSTHVA